MGTSSPVLGFLPTRRPFWRTENVPKPLIFTDSPPSKADDKPPEDPQLARAVELLDAALRGVEPAGRRQPEAKK